MDLSELCQDNSALLSASHLSYSTATEEMDSVLLENTLNNTLLSRSSPRCKPFRDTFNTSTISTNSTKSVLSSHSSTTANPPLYQFTIEINNSPCQVSMFMNEEEGRLYANFLNQVTGELRTKRLSARWLNPPQHVTDKADWYAKNIATVLVKSRGPEKTPVKPPARRPPVVVNNNALLEEVTRERDELKQLLASRDAEISQLKAQTTDAAVDEHIVLAMAREDLREMRMQKLQAETTAQEQTVLCLQALEQAESMEQELEELTKQYTNVMRILGEVTSDLKLSRAQTSLVEAKLKDSEAQIATLSEYVSDRLRGKD